MRSLLLLAVALLAATAAGAVPTVPVSPAAPTSSAGPALQSTPGKFEPLPDEMVGAALLGRALEQPDETAMLAGFDAALAELPRPTRFRGVVQAYRGTALASVERYSEARAALEEAHRLLPDHAGVTMTLGQLLLQQKEMLAGTKLIINAIDAEAATAESLPPTAYESLLRQLRYSRDLVLRDQLTLALVKAGYAARHPEFGSGIAKVAIRARLDAGDIKGAAALLPLFTEPGPVIEMVVNKRFEKLWPAIDTWSGGDLRDMRIATLNAATAQYKANANPDLQATLLYADALWQTGNAEGAVRTLQAALAAPEKWDADREKAVEIASRVSGWQFNLGKLDESLETAQRVLAITPVSRYPQVVNLMINQAMRLAVLGRGSESLAMLDRAAVNNDTSPNFEGEGARLWFDAVRACAAKGADAKPAIDRIEARGAAINPTARNTSLACRGDTAALVHIALAELGAPSSADQMAADLRVRDISDLPVLTLSARSWQAVARDPAVLEALDAVSRPIPLSYVRAANKWRH